MKFLLDELQEDEIQFGDMHLPYREVQKRFRSDVHDDLVTSSLFLITIDTLRSSLMQSLPSSVSTSINNFLNQLSIKAQAISSKTVESSMITNESSDLENQLNLITTVDLTQKHVTGVAIMAEVEN